MGNTATVEVPRKRRSRALLPFVALVLSLAVAGWLAFVRSTPGPIAAAQGDWSQTSVPVEVGGQVSVGISSPIYQGDGTLVIDSIVPDQVPDGLVVLGYGRVPWEQGGVGSARRFPPAGHTLEPVQGATVTNGQGFSIVVGVQPMREGRFLIPGFTIEYHSGIHRYAAHYQQAVAVCAFKAGNLGHC